MSQTATAKKLARNQITDIYSPSIQVDEHENDNGTSTNSDFDDFMSVASTCTSIDSDSDSLCSDSGIND